MDYSKIVKLLKELASVDGVNVEYQGNIYGEFYSNDPIYIPKEIPEQAELINFYVDIFDHCRLCRLEVYDNERAGFRIDVADDDKITNGFEHNRYLLLARDKCVSIMRKFAADNFEAIIYRGEEEGKE